MGYSNFCKFHVFSSVVMKYFVSDLFRLLYFIIATKGAACSEIVESMTMTFWDASYKLDNLLTISMSFPDASKRSDDTFHLKRQLTYTLKFSEELNGQYLSLIHI